MYQSLDKDKIKELLSIEQIFSLVAELGGEPQMGKDNESFIAKTICHNHFGEGSKKLYYYNNTHLFHCYTGCSEQTFDIYSLVQKVHKINGEEWPLPKSIQFVADYFGFSVSTENFSDLFSPLQDWSVLDRYEKTLSIEDLSKQKIELKVYDKNILKYLPSPHIKDWEDEGISYEVMQECGIKYDPIREHIIIPHYDIADNLIGIRSRTLIKEEEIYGKYRPAILSGVQYNHPLGFNLYNLNNSKDAIINLKKAIIFESEKATLMYRSYFGSNSDISVAVCGSSLTNYQIKLLIDLGVEEVIIAFDKDFLEEKDDVWKSQVKRYKDFHKRFSPYVNISFIFDKNNDMLGHKMSPIDAGPEIFIKMFKERIIL